MATFHELLLLRDYFPESIKANYIGKIVEDEKPVYPPEKAGTRRHYHAITRGLILNEIFRRVDPEKRTIGEFLR